VKVVILAAGIGTRLRPITDFVPKPMLPICGKPALEYVIGYLKRQGLRDLLIAVSHLAEQITNYFGDGSRFGVNITYSSSPKPRGTAGEVWAARKYLDDSFICYYGDIITNIDLKRLVKFHNGQGCIATVALVRSVPLEVGVVRLNSDSTVTEFKEKPPLDMPVNAGIYVLDKEILAFLNDKDELDFGYDVFPAILKAGRRICGCLFEKAFWYDLGTLRRYQELNELFSKNVIVL